MRQNVIRPIASSKRELIDLPWLDGSWVKSRTEWSLRCKIETGLLLLPSPSLPLLLLLLLRARYVGSARAQRRVLWNVSKNGSPMVFNLPESLWGEWERDEARWCARKLDTLRTVLKRDEGEPGALRYRNSVAFNDIKFAKWNGRRSNFHLSRRYSRDCRLDDDHLATSLLRLHFSRFMLPFGKQSQKATSTESSTRIG